MSQQEMSGRSFRESPITVKVDSPSFCPRCLAADVNKYGEPLPEGHSTKALFQISHENDGVRIEAIPVKSGAGVFLQGAINVSDSSDGAVAETTYFVHGKDSLLSLLIEVDKLRIDGLGSIDLDQIKLFDAPLQQLSHVIEDTFWKNLTRSLDLSNASLTGKDTKILTQDSRPRIYVPQGVPEQHHYYSQLAIDHPELHLDVQLLPEGPLTPQFIQYMNDKPGLLALAMEDVIDEKGEKTLRASPYVVPGGRFDEMYGWDSYFQVLGLLANGFIELSESMVKHFCFCIQYYGKILNANRSYYLGRSQPPFLTSMGLAVHEKMEKDNSKASNLIRLTLFAAIKDYYSNWMTPPRYHSKTGLSRYQGEGKGFPPEVEPDHFDSIISIYAAKHSMSSSKFVRAYNDGSLDDRDLDEYLRHDRASRESGHDTTYRFVDRAADLATIDLNSCLHKFETDIAHIINTHFDGQVHIPDEWRVANRPTTETAETWSQRAENRRNAIDTYLWSQDKGMYFDYDTVEQAQVPYESATTLWPLWAGAASPSQAERLVKNTIPKLEAHGGLVSSTEKSRGNISTSRPARQWDYPNGWAAHQILAWDGLKKYGYQKIADRLAYRWVSMVLKTFVNQNGLVVEKYDVTNKDKAHAVDAEYGNQGSDLGVDAPTGFGWTNASFVYGVSMLQSRCETC